MKEMIRYIKSWGKLIGLETTTTAGKVNLSFIVILGVFVVAYTTNDMLCYLISAVRDAVKTVALKQDISDPYQTVSVFKMVIPVIILMVACMFYLYIDDNKKKHIDKQEK